MESDERSWVDFSKRCRQHLEDLLAIQSRFIQLPVDLFKYGVCGRMGNNPGAYSYLVFQVPLVSLQYTYSPSLQIYSRLGAHPWPSLSPVISLVIQKDWAITLNLIN